MLVKIREMPDHNEFCLEIEKYYTGLTIIKKIEYIYGLDGDDYTLIYESVRFDDRATVSDMDICEGDIIYLVDLNNTNPENIMIHIKTLSELKFNLYVHPSFTIDIVKFMILCKVGFPTVKQRLVFKGRQLEDGRTISDHNIHENGTITVVLRQAGS